MNSNTARVATSASATAKSTKRYRKFVTERTLGCCLSHLIFDRAQLEQVRLWTAMDSKRDA